MRSAFAVLAAGLLLAFASAGAAATGNLIRNGNAETGPASGDDSSVTVPAGWTTSGSFSSLLYVEPGATIGGSIGAGVSAAIHGGKALFAGGPSNASSSATQTVTIPASWLRAIAAGKVKASLSAALGGWDGQTDAAQVTYAWLDAGGRSLGTTRLGPVTAAARAGVTKLITVARTVAPPAGTRSVRVTIAANRGSGSYNDGYADNVSLVLTG